MLTPALRDSHIALYDIDHERLKDSENMLKNINRNHGNYATIVAYTDRKQALEGADYVVNAIQVGVDMSLCTVIDFEIPKNMGSDRL